MKTVIQLVDDDSQYLESIASIFQEHPGRELVISPTAEQALADAADKHPDVILLDKGLGDDDGIQLIPQLVQLLPFAQILVVTGSDKADDIVRAMKFGACGYILKDSGSRVLEAQVEQAVRAAHDRKQRAVMEVQNGPASENDPSRTVLGGQSFQFRQILNQAQLLAESNRPILLLGETGTGKSALARWIHQTRRKYLETKALPFLSINIASIASSIAESELFGHEKGAFTGAIHQKQGLFELAQDGTLFLDEIGETTPEFQAKLLTVLEEGSFMRIGGSRTLRARCKVILATNRDLENEVKAGRFRQDLYMRISMFPLTLPPLSQRKGDVPDLIRALLPRACYENHVSVSYEEIPADFIEFLTETDFPGNIRALQNQLERALVLAPRDRNGHPLLSHWRKIPGFEPTSARKLRSFQDSLSRSLTLTDLMERPFDVVDQSFPGLSTVIDKITKKIFLDAADKLGRNKDIATALKIAESSASTQLKRFRGDSLNG